MHVKAERVELLRILEESCFFFSLRLKKEHLYISMICLFLYDKFVLYCFVCFLEFANSGALTLGAHLGGPVSHAGVQ